MPTAWRREPQDTRTDVALTLLRVLHQDDLASPLARREQVGVREGRFFEMVIHKNLTG